MSKTPYWPTQTDKELPYPITGDLRHAQAQPRTKYNCGCSLETPNPSPNPNFCLPCYQALWRHAL